MTLQYKIYTRRLRSLHWELWGVEVVCRPASVHVGSQKLSLCIRRQSAEALMAMNGSRSCSGPVLKLEDDALLRDCLMLEKARGEVEKKITAFLFFLGPCRIIQY